MVTVKQRKAMLHWFGLDPETCTTAEGVLQLIRAIGTSFNEVSLSYEKTPGQNGEWVARIKSTTLEVEERAETAWEALEQAGVHFLPDYWLKICQ